MPARTPEMLPNGSFLARLSSGLQTVGEGVAELLWPTRCVLCDVPGTLLCDECRLEIPYIDPNRACPYCGQAYGRHACADCNSFMVKHRGLAGAVDEHLGEPAVSLARKDTSKFPLDGIASVFEFVDPCRKLITTYKDRKEIRLARILAELLNNYVNPAWITPGDTVLAVIPARKQAIRERGFDHMQQIGEHLANLSGLPILDLIEPQERGDQRGLSAARRQRNMRNSFAPKRPGKKEATQPEDATTAAAFGFAQAQSNRQDPQCPTSVFASQLPGTVILVDDVLTTGATLTAAASVLKEMGIHQVFGLTLGRIP